MRKTLISLNGSGLLIAALLFFGAITAAASEYHTSADRHLQLSADPANATLLEISSVNGDIEVIGGDSALISMQVDIVVNGRKEDICRELAEQVRIKVDNRGDRIVVEAETPRKMGYHYSISYIVQMPKRLGLEAETVNGELHAIGASGQVELESTNGSILGEYLSGRVEAGSVNGSILLSNINATSLNAETVNGGIECFCIENAPGSVDISTVNGSIDVKLPANANANLSAETINGGMIVNSGSGKVASKARGSIEMTLGSGGGQYDLSSVNGAITVLVGNDPD